MENYQKEKLVSIIMPIYNEERYLSQAIESVLIQDYRNFELVLIDDCSTDSSSQIIEHYYNEDSRIKIFRNSIHSGVALTRNLGIHNCMGEYIAFLDADDLWLEGKLSAQISFMEKNNLGFSCTGYKNLKNEKISPFVILPPKKLSYKTLLSTDFIGCLTVIYSVSHCGKRLFIDVNHEDYLLWLELLKDEKIMRGTIRECHALYRIGHKSTSSNKLKACGWQWSIYRNELHLGGLVSLRLMIPYICFGILKRLK